MTLHSFHRQVGGRSRPGQWFQLLIAGAALSAAACDNTPPNPSEPQLSAGGGQEKVVLVGFTAAPGPAETALIAALGGQVRHEYKYITAFSATIPADQHSALAAAPGVAYVEANLLLQPYGSTQIFDYGVSKVEAPTAWLMGYRGQGVRVGIFDSGIDVDHPDLVVAGGIDLVGDGNGLDDCNGHGTHVAGIVGARNNKHHTAGVAPSARLYSMRFADCAWAGATLEKMIQGVEWAIDNRMDVINMSFGFGLAGVIASPLSPSQAAEDAFTHAYLHGIVLVAASGNSSTPYVGFPAGYASVIAVGATDEADMLGVFSQWGEDQELTAPGVNNLASYMVGQGQTTTLTVDTDNGRELEAIALAFAGMTGAQGTTTDAVYAGFGTAVEFAGLNCTGKTTVVMRGGPSFAEKTQAAMDAGCVAAIIHNHTPGNFNGTLGTETATDGRPWIPVVSISLDDGLYLKDQIETQATRTTLINAPGNLAILSGTSMASPHAAGVAAIVLSKNPGLSPDQVRQILRESANDLGTPGWDPVFGYGRVNARRALERTH